MVCVGLWGFRVGSFFLYHPAQDRFVYFDRVGVWEDLGNEFALPAFQSRGDQPVYRLFQEHAHLVWVIDDNVNAELRFSGRSVLERWCHLEAR